MRGNVFHSINKERYQWGNKSGKWMARRVKEKKNRAFIPKIRDKGGIEFSSPNFAKIFHSYFQCFI